MIRAVTIQDTQGSYDKAQSSEGQSYRFWYINDTARLLPVLIFAVIWWALPGIFTFFGANTSYLFSNPLILPLYVIAGFLIPMILMSTVFKRFSLSEGVGIVGQSSVELDLRFSKRTIRYEAIKWVVYDSITSKSGGLTIVLKEGRGLSLPINSLQPDETLHDFAEALQRAVERFRNP